MNSECPVSGNMEGYINQDGLTSRRDKDRRIVTALGALCNRMSYELFEATSEMAAEPIDSHVQRLVSFHSKELIKRTTVEDINIAFESMPASIVQGYPTYIGNGVPITRPDGINIPIGSYGEFFYKRLGVAQIVLQDYIVGATFSAELNRLLIENSELLRHEAYRTTPNNIMREAAQTTVHALAALCYDRQPAFDNPDDLLRAVVDSGVANQLGARHCMGDFISKILYQSYVYRDPLVLRGKKSAQVTLSPQLKAFLEKRKKARYDGKGQIGHRQLGCPASREGFITADETHFSGTGIDHMSRAVLLTYEMVKSIEERPA